MRKCFLTDRLCSRSTSPSAYAAINVSASWQFIARPRRLSRRSRGALAEQLRQSARASEAGHGGAWIGDVGDARDLPCMTTPPARAKRELRGTAAAVRPPRRRAHRISGSANRRLAAGRPPRGRRSSRIVVVVSGRFPPDGCSRASRRRRCGTIARNHARASLPWSERIFERAGCRRPDDVFGVVGVTRSATAPGYRRRPGAALPAPRSGSDRTKPNLHS